MNLTAIVLRQMTVDLRMYIATTSPTLSASQCLQVISARHNSSSSNRPSMTTSGRCLTPSRRRPPPPCRRTHRTAAYFDRYAMVLTRARRMRAGRGMVKTRSVMTTMMTPSKWQVSRHWLLLLYMEYIQLVYNLSHHHKYEILSVQIAYLVRRYSRSCNSYCIV